MRKIILSLMALLMLSVSAVAQNRHSSTPENQTPEQQAVTRLETMKEDYTLTDKQEKKILKAFENYYKDAAKVSKDQAGQEKIVKARQTMSTKVLKALNPEQAERYKATQEKMAQRGANRKKNQAEKK
ncbi:MAG: hypothetical protein R3Y08_06935 [Rikenellaceae bacterium]